MNKSKADLLEAMEGLHACTAAYRWVEVHESDSVEEIWNSCTELGWMAWMVHALNFYECPTYGFCTFEVFDEIKEMQRKLVLEVVPDGWDPSNGGGDPLPWEEVERWPRRPPWPLYLEAMDNLRRRYPARWVVDRLTEYLRRERELG